NDDVFNEVMPYVRVLADLLQHYGTHIHAIDTDDFVRGIVDVDRLLITEYGSWSHPCIALPSDWQHHADRFVEMLQGRVTQSEPDQTLRRWTEVLEIGVMADFEEVQTAYRKKISQYHPDRVAGLGPELQALAEKHSKDINRAYADARKSRGWP